METAFVEMVPEGTADFGNYVRDFIDQDYNVIFGTSFGYMDDMLALADEYPDVVFEHNSGYKANDTNFGNTFGRMYEPRYLSGMVAGSATSSNLIGYVAAFPIPEVIRGINAFTLGVREVNPDAEVEVNWTSTWLDPSAEGDAAQVLLDKGADVISMHQDSMAAGQAAEAAGARWVSYGSDMSAFAPEAYLTAPVWNWGPRYAETIEAAQAGTYTPGSYWGSMADGVVDLAPIAADVDSDVTAQVLAAKDASIAGDLHPFTGPLHDQYDFEKTWISSLTDPDDHSMWPLNQTVIPLLMCPEVTRNGTAIGGDTVLISYNAVSYTHLTLPPSDQV